MRTVTTWRGLCRYWSVQISALIPIIAGLSEALPQIQPYVGAKVYAGLAALSILARNWPQVKK